MSQRRPPQKPPVKLPEPEPEDEDEEEMEFDEDEEFGEADLLDALGSWFTTEDGETVASAMAGVKTALEMQNKILIKILSTLSAKPAAKPAPAESEDAIPA
jgi:hypothetical protein